VLILFSSKKGFTLFELFLVIGIMVILLSFLLPVGLSFYKEQQLASQSLELCRILRIAQQKSMSVDLDSSYGVYLTNQNYTLFKGNSFLSRDEPYDQIFNVPEIIQLSGISEVVFSKNDGNPNVTGDIILTCDLDSKTININQIGRINPD
jgi:type II secretory pathway pseudopilin PulG